jgi:hypothetical protein
LAIAAQSTNSEDEEDDVVGVVVIACKEGANDGDPTIMDGEEVGVMVGSVLFRQVQFVATNCGERNIRQLGLSHQSLRFANHYKQHPAVRNR